MWCPIHDARVIQHTMSSMGWHTRNAWSNEVKTRHDHRQRFTMRSMHFYVIWTWCNPHGARRDPHAINIRDGVERAPFKCVEQVFTCLQAAGFKANAEKLFFGKQQLKHLGHWVNNKGTMPLPKKINALCMTEPPHCPLYAHRTTPDIGNHLFTTEQCTHSTKQCALLNNEHDNTHNLLNSWFLLSHQYCLVQHHINVRAKVRCAAAVVSCPNSVCTKPQAFQSQGQDGTGTTKWHGSWWSW